MLREQFNDLKRRNARQWQALGEYNRPVSGHKSGFVQGRLVALLLCTLILTITDGLMTIKLLNLGAWEANPVMRAALSVSTGFFILIKYLLTGGGLLVLLRFGKVRIFDESVSLEEIAAGVVLFYQGLVLYEIECYLLLG